MGVQDRDWYWQDRDAKSRATYNPREFRGRRMFRTESGGSYRSLVGRWLIGVFCTVLVCALGYSVVEWRKQFAAEQIIRRDPDVQQTAELRAQGAQRDEAARQVKLQAQHRQQEAVRFQAIAERQRSDEQATRAAANAVDRKAKAWARFYRKPATCDEVATMECANGFIRAKRAFEEKYARGEL